MEDPTNSSAIHSLKHPQEPAYNLDNGFFSKKYVFDVAQKRRQTKKVFVPTNSIKFNDSVWLANPKQLHTNRHFGWFTSQSNLQSQGYYHGQSVRALPRLDITYLFSRTRSIPASDIPPAWDQHRGKSLSCLEMPTQGGQEYQGYLITSRLFQILSRMKNSP